MVQINKQTKHRGREMSTKPSMETHNIRTSLIHTIFVSLKLFLNNMTNVP